MSLTSGLSGGLVAKLNAIGSMRGAGDGDVVTPPLLDATFETDLSGFDAGTRVASEGADFSTGYLSVAAGETSSRSFSPVTVGVARLDFWVRVNDSVTATDNAANSTVYLLPSSGLISPAASIAAVTLSRNTAHPTITGSSTTVGVGYLVSSGWAAVGTVNPYRRSNWMKLGFAVDVTGKTFDLYFNDVLWLRAAAWTDVSAADFGRVVVVGG